MAGGLFDPMANPGMADALGAPPAMPMGAEPVDPNADPNAKIVDRQEKEIDRGREELVTKWRDRVVRGKDHWDKPFKQMREDQKFASGQQWPDNDNRGKYVANITLRHVQQRVAQLYAKNPRIIAKRKEMLMSSVWDGTQQSLQMAMMSLQQGMVDPNAMMILQDAQQTQMQNAMLTKVAKTLELVFTHELSEQALPFKTGMKMVVRRAVTVGVGYVKLGFQRVMELSPDIEARINDYSQRLATVERLSADIADGELEKDGAEAEELRLAIAALQGEQQILVREGLVFDYPDSWSIIPDPKCRQLKGFLGCDWVAQEYLLDKDTIQEIWGVDVGSGGAIRYSTAKDGSFIRDSIKNNAKEADTYAVFEIYCRKDGLVYVVCDGHKDFLQEPAAPEVWTERFWPWFPLTINDCYSDEAIFPPSDVFLIRDMQMEINRMREGMREHRKANRPKTVTSAGVLDQEDKDKLTNHPANALIELNALQPGQSVDQLIQAWKGSPIDPNLYETNGAEKDLMMVVGTQEANLGPTSGATATETGIAESSRMSAHGSTVDELDELLTELARAGGQILLSELQPETVKEIAGPGAVWPQLDRELIAKEIYLEIEAASTGRPNKALEVQNAQALAPIIMQIPGISPEWFAREMIRRMDDRLDLTEAFAAGVPSMASMNSAGGMGAPGAGPGQAGQEPGSQGPQGAQNAPRADKQTAGPQAPGPQAPPTPF